MDTTANTTTAVTFMVELDSDDRNYGRIHAAGCRDLRDGETLGHTLDDIAEDWPWSESVDEILDEGGFQRLMLPCARKLT